MAKREFVLPDIGSGMVEAEIVTWHVAVGDVIKADQPLVEIETEKAVAEVPVPFSGRVVELGADEGESIEVGKVLVVIEAEGAAEPDTPEPSQPRAASRTEAAPESKAPTAKPFGKAMPSVRRLARKHDIDLTTVQGTGRAGSVTMADIERMIKGASPDEQATPSAESRTRMSKLRRTIAERMAQSWRKVPHISGHTEAVVERLFERRAALAEELGTPVSLEALVIKAVIPLLIEFPSIHAWVDGEDLVSYARMDIGVAVDTPEGLMVPVVRGCEGLSLQELSERIADLAARAISHKLTIEEMADNTFTVSNLGPFVSAHATQILPPGTTGIISLGRATKKLVVDGNAFIPARVMPISISVDHRAVDGAVAARFLAALKANLEEPERFDG